LIVFQNQSIEMYFSKINRLNWKNNPLISLKCKTIVKGQLLHVLKSDFFIFQKVRNLKVHLREHVVSKIASW